jgi:hypothetical protein
MYILYIKNMTTVPNKTPFGTGYINKHFKQQQHFLWDSQGRYVEVAGNFLSAG